MNRLPVALFSSCARAEPLRQRLTQAGIAAEIHDELRLEKLWFVSKPAAGARVEVPANQFERAEQLLSEWDKTQGSPDDAIRCPECHSLRVDYPQFTRKSLMTNFFMGLGAQLGLIEKNYYCEDCHFTWPKQGTKPSRARPNMAPYYFIEGVEQTHRGTAEHRQAA